MNQHLSDADLATFGSRKLDPGALIEMDRHLAACPDCRARLRTCTGTSRTHAWLQREILEAPGRAHLTFEEVQALAEGQAAAEAAQHAADCPACRAEIEDLRQAIPRVSRGRRWYWAAAAAAVLALAAPLAWKVVRSPGGEEFATQVRDGGGVVALDRQGRLHTPSAISGADADAVAGALRTGRLAAPGSVLDLSRQRELLLGSETAPARAVVLREPVGEAVITRRPRFTWSALEGASVYRVRVYDENFRKVAESPRAAAIEWTADRDLDAGHIYSWTVTADVRGQEVRAPLPPAPEAKFAVPAAEAMARIEEARRLHRDQHLLLASLYTSVGAWSQARAELAELARANPDSAVVRGLEASLPKAH